MTAHVRIQAPVLGDIDDFAEVCGFELWFVQEGWKTKQLAVDQLQNLAELWGLITEHGQDAVQAIMANAFSQLAEVA